MVSDERTLAPNFTTHRGILPAVGAPEWKTSGYPTGSNFKKEFIY